MLGNSNINRPAADSGRYDLPPVIEWTTTDKPAGDDKGPDWYWAVALVIIAFAISASLFGNHLFGALLVVAGIALILQEVKPSEEVAVTVNERGVRIGNELFPYRELESFWVETEESDQPMLLLRSQKTLAPLVSVAIDPEAVDLDDLTDYLLEFLDEEELEEPLGQKFLEWLGFRR